MQPKLRNERGRNVESEEQRNSRLGLRGYNMSLLYLMSFGSTAVIIGFFVWLIMQDPNIGTYPLQKWLNLGIVTFIAGPLFIFAVVTHVDEEERKHFPPTSPSPMPLVMKIVGAIWFVLSILGFVYLKAQT